MNILNRKNIRKEKCIISIIKKIVQNIRLLNVLKPGDLIWSKMPLSRRELKMIEETHRIRPYLVIYKKRFCIYAFPSSSKKSKKLNNYQEYKLNKFRYSQNRDSYIKLTKVYKIPFINFSSNYKSLEEIDLKNIQKRLQINKSIYNFSVDIYISEGDVVEINQLQYYVYASDNVNVYCFPIFNFFPGNSKNYEKIIINKKVFYTCFEPKIQFDRKLKMDIKNIAYNDEIDIIMKQKNEYTQICKREKSKKQTKSSPSHSKRPHFKKEKGNRPHRKNWDYFLYKLKKEKD